VELVLMWLARISLALGALAVVLLLLAGPGVRFGAWHYSSGFLLLRVAVFMGGAAAVLALAGFIAKSVRSAHWPVLALGLVLGLGAAAIPLELQRRARAVPPINDISTAGDTAPAVAEQQRRAYPDIVPLTLKASPEEAFARALQAARDMGWEIVSADAVAQDTRAHTTTRPTPTTRFRAAPCWDASFTDASPLRDDGPLVAAAPSLRSFSVIATPRNR
jgi:hypothetical protein